MTVTQTAVKNLGTIHIYRWGDVSLYRFGPWRLPDGTAVDFTAFSDIDFVAFHPEVESFDKQAWVHADPIVDNVGFITAQARKSEVLDPYHFGSFPFVLTARISITDPNQVIGVGRLVYTETFG